jgi:CRISPR system Cascade subunit CasE
VCGHHGALPTRDEPDASRTSLLRSIRLEDVKARRVFQERVVEFFVSHGATLPWRTEVDGSLVQRLAGLCAVSDWLGSNVDHFCYRPGPILDLESYWARSCELFPGYSPRDVQTLTEQILVDVPALIIVEAEMGKGKTEAALSMAARFLTRGIGEGLTVALPTMATSNKTVMRAFPDNAGPSPRGAHGILYRLDEERGDRLVLLVQSRTKPMTERWPAGYVLDVGGDLDPLSSVGENPAVRSVEADSAALRAGRRLAFRLRANTTRKVDTKSGPDGVRRHGRRVPVRGDDERLRWLSRRAEAAGFTIEDGQIRITEIATSGGRGGKSVTFGGALFEGILVVRDADLFPKALASGIGPAKAYGFGLLSIVKAP